MPRALVVSIHDVAPATQRDADEILRQLKSRGVQNCSLLVVPDYHHRGRSMNDATFCAWLREMEKLGHEIVIHGFYHQRARRAGERTRDKLITRFYTADEGEFFDLRYAAALDLIRQARDEFAARDFRPVGFIAPAWLLSPEAERAVKDAGLSYTTTLRAVRDLIGDRTFVAQSLVYSVRSGWRRAASLRWNRWLATRLAPNELLRLSIHPPDVSHPAIWRQILRLAEEALRSRRAVTYQRWLQDGAPIANRPTASV